MLLPATALILSSCGGNSGLLQAASETTHGADAVEAAEQAAEAQEAESSESSPNQSAANGHSEPAELAACDAESADIQASVMAIINEARTSGFQCGSTNVSAKSSMGWSSLLEDAARAHAEDMADANFFDHMGSNGLYVDNRAEAAGYLWLSVGENIAAGPDHTEEVMNDWLASEGHCNNIMSDSYTEVAVACATNTQSQYGEYWVMVLATPLPR